MIRTGLIVGASGAPPVLGGFADNPAVLGRVRVPAPLGGGAPMIRAGLIVGASGRLRRWAASPITRPCSAASGSLRRWAAERR